MAGGSWSAWGDMLVTDQRFVDGRPDVLTYETPMLTAPVGVRGMPLVDLRAMTTGTDADFVVKLIDVYPADFPNDPKLRGFELPIAMDILRGAIGRVSSIRRRSRRMCRCNIDSSCRT